MSIKITTRFECIGKGQASRNNFGSGFLAFTGNW